MLAVTVIAAIVLLAQRSDAAQNAELALAGVKIQLNQLQVAPFRADKSTGGSPELARSLMGTGKEHVARTLVRLRRESPPAELAELAGPLRTDFDALDQIYLIGISG